MIPNDEVIELLQSLIRNACVNDGTPDSGHEHRSAATLQGYFGVDGTIVEGHPGRQNLIYRVPGSNPAAPTLLLIPHLDVVPASDGGWTYDPFAATRADGYIWGRGALDMLNVTSSMAAIFKRYLDGSLPPLPGDLVFAATADEEAGSVLGAELLAEEHWDLVACDYLLTEVANPSFETPSGPVLPVTVAEKGPAWRRLSTRGAPGHGSQPYGSRNALIPLAHAISRLAEAPTPVDITDEWRTFVVGLELPDDLTSRLLDPDLVDGAIDDLAVDDPIFARWVHACTHMTITPSGLHSGIKSNVVPEDGFAEVDVRKLPGQDETDVNDHFRKVLGPDLDEVDIDPIVTFPANASPYEGLLWEAIGDAAEELAGHRRLLPAITPVATDARFFRARGVTAYGVGLFDDEATFGGMLAMFHGDDERVSEESVRRTTAMLERTVARFGELS
ncbi:MAG: M20/M25/M40 family metallo-hydrolase [Acidimicrobiia bacterium]|nr:M20/M25/M40 family metallo-hydrolase [Acidimicrobiia bacterium]